MKAFIILCLALANCTTIFAQQPQTSSLLWKITGKQLTKPSYIYGTIHLMCPDDIVVSDTLKSAFNSTKKLYLEVNMEDPSVLFKTMQYMKMPGDTTLQMLLPKLKYDSVAAGFKRISPLPFSMINFMRPMLAMSLIYPSLLGCQGAEAWEQKFLQMAKANNEKVDGLEEVEEQINIFKTIPLQEQADMLASSLLNTDSLQKSFDELVNAYRSKDLNKLYTLLNEDPDEQKYQDVMLNKRNHRWIPVIEKAMKEQPSFIAVGAGHLAGENGVLSLLKKEGYSAEAIAY